MDLTKEAIEKIEQLSETKVIKINERNYTNKEVHEVMDPEPETLICRNLSSIVDYVKTNIDSLEQKGLLLHVISHQEVALVSKLESPWLNRKTYLQASIKDCSGGHRFGQKHDQENFIISLQSNFVKTDTLIDVIGVVGNMKSGNVNVATDDGMTQTVEVKAGVTLANKKEVPNPIALKPYRTFIEIAQPESDFVLRVFKPRDEGCIPECALFEADGGLWKQTAVDSIKEFFKKALPDISVIA